MTEFFTEAEKRRRRLAGATTIVLLACAVALAVAPRAVERLTGIRPAPNLSSPDDLPGCSSIEIV